MIPPSTKDIIDVAESKYAVVVAVAKRARELSEDCKNEESYRLSDMVTKALEDVMEGKIKVSVQWPE